MNSSFQELLNEKSARDFLKKALLIHYNRQGQMNLADFSRKAGFSSRSFLSEYLSGKKNLSRDSLDRINLTLKLTKPYKQYFSLLVAIEQPGLSRESKSKDLEKELIVLKNSILQKELTLREIKTPKAIIGKKNLYRIFAGLGNETEGSSLSDIIQRTNLPAEIIQNGLQVLLDQSVISYKEQRFFAKHSQVDFLNITTHELSSLTQEICTEIGSQSEQIVNSKDQFVFYTAVSVQSHQLALFKEKLREALYSVLDQFQCDTGNSVQQIFLCSKK